MTHLLVWSNSVDDAHLELRFQVLRVGMPRGSEHYPDVDNDIRTKFLCAYVGEQMVGSRHYKKTLEMVVSIEYEEWQLQLNIGI